MYDAPKPKPMPFDEDILVKFDKHSFGSKIGAITNKSTSAIALLPIIEKEYGIESKEYEVLLNRIRMCTKLQNSEIDKTKIGQKMKGIPKTWTDRKFIDSLELSDEDNKLLKTLLLDRHPYFFIHLYNDTKKKYTNHYKKYDISVQNMFGLTLEDLIKKECKTEDEQKVIDLYKKYNPVIDSNSVMNNICKYIESINADVQFDMKSNIDPDVYLHLLRYKQIKSESNYKKVIQAYKEFKKELALELSLSEPQLKNKYDVDVVDKIEISINLMREKFDSICDDICETVDYLILAYYVDVPTDNKLLLWESYGDIILNNIMSKRGGVFEFPFPSEKGDMIYLNQTFEIRKVDYYDK